MLAPVIESFALPGIGAHLAPGMAPNHFRGVRIISLSWSPFTESNRRPSPYHGDALPTELKGPVHLSDLRLGP